MTVPRPLVALSISLGLAAASGSLPAGAAPFNGTLGISVGPFGTLSFGGAGSGTSTANSVVLPGGTFGGTATIPALPPEVPPITAIKVAIAGNGAGSLLGNPLGGTLPIFGAAAVKGDYGFGPATLVNVPLFTSHDPGSAAGANGLGVGGSVLLKFTDPLFGYHQYLSVFHTGWTEGMKTVTGLFYTYVYHFPSGMKISATSTQMYSNGTVAFTGTDSRTPGGLGQVTLVSPTKVVTTLLLRPPVFVVLGTLTLNFVPEPGTLLLLGSGVAGLALLGRRRMGPR